MMLLKIFFAAIAIRWAYALLLFMSMGDASLQGVDSMGYLTNAHVFAQAATDGSLHGLAWLGSNTLVMPLFLWLIGLNVLLFGTLAPLTFVLMQGVIDSGTCLIIYGIARSFDPRFGLPAAVAAVLNPTQIVLSGFVYTDTLFVFFVAVFLYASVRWLRKPSLPWASLIGFGLGAATMVRALAAPWAPLLLLFLLAIAIGTKRMSRQIAAQILTAAAIFGLCIAPVLWRNVSQFGAWSLTSQSGTHLAMWVVPLVKEARDGTPWQQSYEAMQRRIDQRFPTPATDPFDQSRRATEIASEALAELGIAAMAKAWITGAAINIAAPAIILSPPISQLPHTGFYGTSGASPFEKIGNFLFHSDNAIYAWILLAGIAGVTALRVVQLAGLFSALRYGNQAPALWLFALWFFYILVINGPVASPKYRLPLEPPLTVLTGAGIALLRRRPD